MGQSVAPASERFVNELVKLPSALDPHPLLQALSDPAAGVVRAKGWLTDLSGQCHLLQQVGRRIEMEPLPAEVAPAGPDRLLVIGLAGVYRRGSLLSIQ
ncbi:MAG: cobalamin biosynthesis protein CobW [Rhodoferax sp.]|nr:cobalamin biosynthesis protein CobW [Rhodoferax sp.]